MLIAEESKKKQASKEMMENVRDDGECHIEKLDPRIESATTWIKVQIIDEFRTIILFKDYSRSLK